MKSRQRIASGALLPGCWLAVGMPGADAAALPAPTLTHRATLGQKKCLHFAKVVYRIRAFARLVAQLVRAPP